MICHHPTEPTLLAYAAGKLPQALGIVAATHLARCALCRRSLATLEATGGLVLDDLTPEPLKCDALNNVLSRLDQPAPSAPPVLNPDLPAPLNRVQLGRWWRVGRGTQWRPLHTTAGAFGGLILVQPNRSLPRHGHRGLELTCVLSGSFADASGHYHAGDLSEPETDHDEPPRVLGDQPCLCIIASEGFRLRGMLGLAQRMIGQ